MGDQRDIEADLAALGGIVPSHVPVDRPLEVPSDLGSMVPAWEAEHDLHDAVDPLVEAHAQHEAAQRVAEPGPGVLAGLPGRNFGIEDPGPDASDVAFEAELDAEAHQPPHNEGDAASPAPEGLQRFAFLRPGADVDMPPEPPAPDGPPEGFDQLAPDDPELHGAHEPLLATANALDSLAGFAPQQHAHLEDLGHDAASLTAGASLQMGDDLSGFSPKHDPKAHSALTPEERAQKLAQILADEHIHAQAQDLVLEFGELARIERSMSQVVKDNSDPSIALVLTSVCRQAIHRVASENPGLAEPGHKEAGIAARLEAMKELQQRLDDHVHPLLDRLKDAGVEVASLRRGVDNVVDAEQRRLGLMGENLVPETFGHRIINNVMRLASKAFDGPSPLSGDLRRHRSAQLKQTLEDLGAVTKELRENAGNPEWERATGEQAMGLTMKLVGDVGRMTHGIEDQVDQAAISTALASAGDNMKIASEKAADNDMKARMKQMVEAMEAAIKRITEAILRALGIRASDAPAGGPTVPLRPTPQPGRP